MRLAWFLFGFLAGGVTIGTLAFMVIDRRFR